MEPTDHCTTKPRSAESSEARAEAAGALPGRWVQDENGPRYSVRKTFVFQNDGTYRFELGARPPGSPSPLILAQDDGRYTVERDQIVFYSTSGSTGVYRFELEGDPVLGQPALVLVDSYGGRNRYDREASDG
jgi:hypothetical protein